MLVLFLESPVTTCGRLPLSFTRPPGKFVWESVHVVSVSSYSQWTFGHVLFSTLSTWSPLTGTWVKNFGNIWWLLFQSVNISYKQGPGAVVSSLHRWVVTRCKWIMMWPCPCPVITGADTDHPTHSNTQSLSSQHKQASGSHTEQCWKLWMWSLQFYSILITKTNSSLTYLFTFIES